MLLYLNAGVLALGCLGQVGERLLTESAAAPSARDIWVGDVASGRNWSDIAEHAADSLEAKDHQRLQRYTVWGCGEIALNCAIYEAAIRGRLEIDGLQPEDVEPGQLELKSRLDQARTECGNCSESLLYRVAWTDIVARQVLGSEHLGLEQLPLEIDFSGGSPRLATVGGIDIDLASVYADVIGGCGELEREVVEHWAMKLMQMEDGQAGSLLPWGEFCDMFAERERQRILQRLRTMEVSSLSGLEPEVMAERLQVWESETERAVFEKPFIQLAMERGLEARELGFQTVWGWFCYERLVESFSRSEYGQMGKNLSSYDPWHLRARVDGWFVDWEAILITPGNAQDHRGISEIVAAGRHLRELLDRGGSGAWAGLLDRYRGKGARMDGFNCWAHGTISKGTTLAQMEDYFGESFITRMALGYSVAASAFNKDLEGEVRGAVLVPRGVCLFRTTKVVERVVRPEESRTLALPRVEKDFFAVRMLQYAGCLE